MIWWNGKKKKWRMGTCWRWRKSINHDKTLEHQQLISPSWHLSIIATTVSSVVSTLNNYLYDFKKSNHCDNCVFDDINGIFLYHEILPLWQLSWMVSKLIIFDIIASWMMSKLSYYFLSFHETRGVAVGQWLFHANLVNMYDTPLRQQFLFT